MPNLPQFESDNPIINEVPVVDKSQGMEAIAKTLGAVSHELVEAAGSMGEQQSNAMLAQSQAHIDTIKTNAKIELIHNPGHGRQIAESVAKDYAAAVDQAVVNKADRNRLRQSANSDLNAIRLDAAQAEHGVAKRQGQVSFYETYPKLLAGVKESIGNEKEFNDRVDTARSLISSAIVNEVLTPRQGEAAFQALNLTMKQGQAYMQAAGGGREMTAHEYHQMKGGMIPIDDGTHMGQPVDHNTAHVYSSQTNDLTFQTLKANIAEGNAGNPQAWGELNENQINEVLLWSDGAHSVYAGLKAGSLTWPQIEQEVKTLTSSGPLTTTQEGRLNALKHVMGQGAQGQLDSLLSDNPLYREATYDYNKQVAAVSNAALDPTRKNELVKSYDNDFIWKKASLFESLHIPPELQQPLDKAFIAPTLAVWAKPDADPAPLLTRIDYLDQANKEWLARAQPAPNQREATRIVANGKGGIIVGNGLFGGIFSHGEKITDNDLADVVLANQKNRDFSNIKPDETKKTDPFITRDINQKLHESLLFISKQPGGAERVAALSETALNYIKYQAQKENDVTLSNYSRYLNKATGIINAANPVNTGVRWSVNAKDIPATDYQMDQISNFMLNNVRMKLENVYGKESTQAMISSNALSIVSTPTGHLAVVDAAGNTLMQERYSGRLHHYATGKLQDEEAGLIAPGNIDLNNRPEIQNPDGSVSTVKTITIEEDGRTILLPTIVNGKELSKEEAVNHYHETGEHMGKFKTQKDADRYDKNLHKEKGWTGVKNTWEGIDEANQQVDEDLKETEKWRKRGTLGNKKLKKMMADEKAKLNG